MCIRPPKRLTDLARLFLEPANTTHRQYEALRAFFVEGLPSAEAARRFGYTPGSFRVLCHQLVRIPVKSHQLGTQVANGYETAKSSHIFRDLVNSGAQVILSRTEVTIRMHKRSHNPRLIAAGFPHTRVPIPWLGGKILRFDFGS